MNENEYGFCPKCGSELAENSNYCPGCGIPVRHTENLPNTDSSSPLPMGGGFLIAVIMSATYAVMAIVLGAMIVANSVEIFNYLNQASLDQFGMNFVDYIAQNGFTVTQDQIIQMFKYSGLVSLLSGVMAGAAAVLCIIRRYRTVAAILLVIGGAIVLIGGGILNLIIAILLAFVIYRSEEYFIE